jgi:PhzF family phenazine biosynthesis protein
MKQYIVDAFTEKVFHGNPAAVCIMDEWLSEKTMIEVADENHLSETAFAVKEGEKYHLRWFTPGGEIDLCGHATLATAFVLMNYYEKNVSKIVFDTMSGELYVTRYDDLYELNFPAYKLKQVPVTDDMEDAIGIRPIEAWTARDLVCVLPSKEDVCNYTPDLDKVKNLPGLLLHTTAAGKESVDCVTRSFAPKLSVPEDPVCGSGHCHVVPLWAGKLKKDTLTAYQASKRGGTLCCRMNGDRVALAGKAVLFAKSEVFID